MTIYTPYVYMIGWTELDLWYIGSEYGSRTKIANPDNLWKTYFTSSKSVGITREEYGEPDYFEIIKTFENAEETVLYESELIKENNAVKNERFLNKTDNCREFLISEEQRKIIARKVQQKLKGRKLGEYSEERKKSMRVPKINKYVPTEEEKLRKSEHIRNIQRERVSKGIHNFVANPPRKGTKCSLETKLSMSRKQKGTKKPYVSDYLKEQAAKGTHTFQSKEFNDKRIRKQCKYVYVVENINTNEIYENVINLAEFGRQHNIFDNCLRGTYSKDKSSKPKYYKGYRILSRIPLAKEETTKKE